MERPPTGDGTPERQTDPAGSSRPEHGASLVVNLSSRNLTPMEEKVLNRGLGFVSTNTGDPFLTQIEMSKFFRKVRLHFFFSKAEPADILLENTGLKKPSTFSPLTAMVPAKVVTFEEAVQHDIQELFRQSHNPFVNISKPEQEALKDLANDRSITIKSADKGGATVLLDTSTYREECLHQLGDTRSYQLLTTDPTPRLKTTIGHIVEEALAEGWITTKEAAYLTTQHPVTPYFYVLPKIHKARRPPPGRPIISGIGSILEPLSTFVDVFLRPMVKLMPTYLQDTKDLLRLLPELDFNILTDHLVSFDVESLYTSIPQNETLEAIESLLGELPWESITPIPLVMNLATIAMKENFFEFEGQFYLQTSGTSMGSVFAPSLANLYMHKFEQDCVLTNENPFLGSICSWKRYIDDILVIWRGDERSLHDFHSWLNEQNTYLRFTLENSQHSLAFLDLLITATPQGLKSELYRKPMARNSLLQYTSCHPKSLRDNLPYGQFLRVQRNCTIKEDSIKHSDDLASKLAERSYPKKLIRRSMKRAANSNREALLEPPVPKTKNDRLTFVNTFSTRSNAIQRIVRKHWRILNTGADSLPQPLFAFKRATSLRDKLVHTRPPPKEIHQVGTIWNMPPVTGHHPCGNCAACPQTKKTTSVDIGTNRPWEQKRFTNCNSSNLIYLITCPCALRYVGMTTRKIRTRISEHKSTIRCKKQATRLTNHFIQVGHRPTEFEWTVLEQPNIPTHITDISRYLFKIEQKWVYKLNSDKGGLNEDIPWMTL